MNTENTQSHQQSSHHEKIATLENMQKDLSKKMSQIERIMQKSITDNATPVPTYSTRNDQLASYMRYAKLEYDSQNIDCHETKGASNNVFIPQKEISDRLHSKVAALSPVYQLSRKVSITSSAFEYIEPITSGPMGRWITSIDGNLGKEDITFKRHKIPTFDLETISRTPRGMLEDLSFDVEEWFLNEVSKKFAVMEEKAFLHGDGKIMPSGILNTTEIASAELSFNALTLEHFVDLFYSLEDRFSRNATFIVSAKVAKFLAKLKDASGKYIVDSALRNGVTKLLNTNVIVSQNMVHDGVDTILLGNFEEGYLVVERQETRVLRNPYIDQRCVTFYVTRRVGGALIDSSAFRRIKLISSK
ncbi:Putative HK97 family phage capsid protein [Candidatus Fokinia solitaria]|uniref:HK97 family phage capsid protein n=1 Tax=Candidatus Fokinia solitaria TaxID=1802984 RepID=A0A2U8BRC6_9RICK|nr:phage major capsid protein [Candidatus Fokinia solitaria]AWD32820.1 Putative HK97 family phage capsid protein [Candidatus Fokinia solitaria]